MMAAPREHNRQLKINKSIPVPLYYQIAELLRSEIRTGQLKSGDRIPPERELSEQFGVSRMTVHQAVSYLVNLGVLVVRRGSGTFVAEPKVAHDTLRILGFQEEITRQGGTVRSKVISQELVDPPAMVRESLALKQDQQVVRIVRVREAWETPLLLERSFISAAICPGLEDIDLEDGSLYAVLNGKFGIELSRSAQSLEATVASEYESKLFGVAEGAPMVLLDSVTYDSTDRPIEYCKALYRGDRFRFYAESRGTHAESPLVLYLRDADGGLSARDVRNTEEG